MAGTTRELVEQSVAARRAGRLDDAHRDLVRAVDVGRQQGSRRELVGALKGLAQIERDLGRSEAAVPYYEEAVALCREEGEPLLLSHTVRHLGDVHRAAGRVELAETFYREALALYRGHGNPPPLDLANAIRPLAILKQDAGNAKEARELWSKARELYTAAQVPQGVEECSRRLAQLGVAG